MSKPNQQPEITLSSDQEEALGKLMEWYERVEGLGDKMFITLGGYAGTGKTTLISHFRKLIKSYHEVTESTPEETGEDIEVAFLAFTGKATAVMRKKLWESGASQIGDTIMTIHSFMYKVLLDKNGSIKGWEWRSMQDKNTLNSYGFEAPHADLFVIDEASMVPSEIFEDLIKYKKPIVFVGDHGQLPPVNGVFNLMANPQIKLEHIHRQAEDNPIIKVAHLAREGKPISYEPYSDHVRRMKKLDKYAQGLVESPGPDTMVIVATNAKRTAVNEYVRKRLGYSGEPQPGERIICLRNDHALGLYNGMLATIQEVKDPKEYSNLNYQMKIVNDEGNYFNIPVARCMFLNTKGEIPKYAQEEWKHLGKLFDFAYAITCHKAQGSEADKVVVSGQGFGSLRNRWLYTAITRAKKEVYLVD